MPSDPSSTQLPADALDAFLEGLMKELKSPADPATLMQIRAAFRRRIPFHMRSYAAALLILRAAGLSRGASARSPKETPSPSVQTAKTVEPAGRVFRSTDPSEARSPKPPVRSPASAPAPSPAPAKVAKRPAKAEPAKKDAPRARPALTAAAPEAAQNPAKPHTASHALSVPSTPLFVSMGRRQRLRAAEVRELFMQKAGLGADDVGQVRLFDNYCFVDIATDKSQAATAAVDGSDLRGRKISVGPAKPRGESGHDSELTAASVDHPDEILPGDEAGIQG